MKIKSVYDAVYQAYRGINEGRSLPYSLKCRLVNICARFLNYNDFLNQFGLRNEYDVLKFVLDDNNVEELIRYSLQNTDFSSLASVRRK